MFVIHLIALKRGSSLDHTTARMKYTVRHFTFRLAAAVDQTACFLEGTKEHINGVPNQTGECRCLEPDLIRL